MGSCNIDAMFRLLATTILLCPATVLAEDLESPRRLPAYVLQLPATVTDALIVETSSSTLYEFSNTDRGLGLPQQRYVSIGQNGVGKQRAGDRRTPLGIYFISEQLDTSRLHEKYGPTAFPIDYPNEWDRQHERGGDGIWIHGVTPGSGRRPPLDTDGCVALDNAELLELAEVLVPHVTPVVIAREIRWEEEENIAALRDELNEELTTWKQSLMSGDLHRYISMYAEDFQYRGMTRDEWIAYRLPSFATAVDDVLLDEVVLLADPEDQDVFLSRFRQKIVEPARTIVTIKRLYWRRSEAGGFKIVAEDNG